MLRTSPYPAYGTLGLVTGGPPGVYRGSRHPGSIEYYQIQLYGKGVNPFPLPGDPSEPSIGRRSTSGAIKSAPVGPW